MDLSKVDPADIGQVAGVLDVYADPTDAGGVAVATTDGGGALTASVAAETVR